jgi:hypothetical protein
MKNDSQNWKFMDQSWLKFIKSNDRISKFNTSFETVTYLRTKQNLSLYPNSNQHFDRLAGIFFIGSGHCNILFWRSHCSESNDAIRWWFQLVVNELWNIKDFDSFSLPSLDICAHSYWLMNYFLPSRSNVLSFLTV